MIENAHLQHCNILLINIHFQARAKIPKNFPFFFLLFRESVRSVMFDQTWHLYSLSFIFQEFSRKMSYSEARHLSSHLTYKNNKRLWIWNFSLTETILLPFCEKWLYIIHMERQRVSNWVKVFQSVSITTNWFELLRK